MINKVFIAVIAYLLGNIMGSYIISMNLFNEDIRSKGSGNAGATNMLRNYGLKPALITALIDALKGLLAVVIGYMLNKEYGPYIAGVFVLLGHIWPIFLKFKGGKGIATSVGVLLFHAPVILLLAIIFFIIIAKTTKYVSLASITAAAFVLILSIFMYYSNTAYMIMVSLMFALVVIAHRSNIVKLIRGEESKTQLKK